MQPRKPLVDGVEPEAEKARDLRAGALLRISQVQDPPGSARQRAEAVPQRLDPGAFLAILPFGGDELEDGFVEAQGPDFPGADPVERLMPGRDVGPGDQLRVQLEAR